MARIVSSGAAPNEAVRYSFAGAEFELDGKNASFESDDPAVLGNAEAHPWLKVERDPDEVVQGEYRDFLDPRDDALSSVNSVANDPKAAREALPSASNVIAPTAIQSGRDQGKKVEIAGVAETVAASAAATEAATDNERND